MPRARNRIPIRRSLALRRDGVEPLRFHQRASHGRRVSLHSRGGQIADDAVGIFRSIVITGGYRETGLASRRKQPRLFRPGDYFSIARDKYTFLAGESRIRSAGPSGRKKTPGLWDRTFPERGTRRRDDDSILPILAR